MTNYTLKKASEHIYYEAWMFYETAKRVRMSSENANTNIQLDAFAIHTRNLFNFFYPSKKQSKKDDIWVTDYIERRGDFNKNKSNKSELRFILRKAGKQVGHLTYSRNRYNEATKGWPVKEVVEKMHQTIKAFYDSLPDNYKSWEYMVKLNQLMQDMES